jgi:hypothetical protein
MERVVRPGCVEGLGRKGWAKEGQKGVDGARSVLLPVFKKRLSKRKMLSVEKSGRVEEE